MVALRKESVDRNCDVSLNYKEVLVALRKESVDRNNTWICRLVALVFSSLSARRAWIEIGKAETTITPIGESLSARRAWIEIFCAA